MPSVAERLRVGIVGYGAVGRRRRAVIDRHPDLVTVGLCDPARAPEADGLPCFPRLEPLLALGLDALFVCTPPDVAPTAAAAGLASGAHVFCEKPPGRCAGDVAAVRAVEARNPRLKLMYGFNHRLHGSVRRARSLIASGALGRLVNLRGVYGRSFVADPAGGWRGDPARAGGGILMDQGIHLADLLLLFAGPFVDVHAFVERRTHGLPLDDDVYALLRSADGAVAFLHSSATEWRHRFTLDVTLTAGALSLAGLHTPGGSYAPERLVVRRRGERPGEASEEAFEFDDDPSWAEEVAAFARAIREDGPVEHGSSRDALAVMELVDRIYRSDPRGRV